MYTNCLLNILQLLIEFYVLNRIHFVAFFFVRIRLKDFIDKIIIRFFIFRLLDLMKVDISSDRFSLSTSPAAQLKMTRTTVMYVT